MFELKSHPDKKGITVTSYEEAQAIANLSLSIFGKELIIYGEIPEEFDISVYNTFLLKHRTPTGRDKVAYALSTDLVILGKDLANFESVDYTQILKPYVDKEEGLVNQFKAGNEKALNALMGKFLKENKGHDAKIIKESLTRMLA